MAISIPALLDTQLAALRVTMEPVQDGATSIASYAATPGMLGNRVADILNQLMDLIDSGTMTVQGLHGAADATNPTAAADASDLATGQTLANEIKADYNAHRILTVGGVHAAADATNVITSADATNQATLNTLLNELKADFNLHIANDTELDEIITLLNEIKADYEAHRIDTTSHGAADATNVIAAADSTNLATALVLANELRTDFNAHVVLIGGGEHVNVGATLVTAGAATTLGTLVTLANDLRTQYEAHRADASTLEESITLANELKADYNAHGADTTVHNAADATNVVAAANATDLATAQTLANEIKADYEAHRVLISGGEHGTADATNAIAAADATDLATLVTLVNELKLDINAHMLMPSLLEECITLVNEIKADYNAHIVFLASVHGAADTTNPTAAADATDLATAQTLANEIKADYEAHRILTAGGVHGGADATNAVSSADATDLASLVTLANELKLDYNAHRVLVAGSVHGVADTANIVASADADTTDVHDNDDTTNTVTSPDAETAAVHEVDDTTNTVTAVAINASSVHPEGDTVNVITSADASSLATSITLANELKADYNAHIANVNGLAATQVVDLASVTTADSLVGATITFAAATTTVALRGQSSTIVGNTVDGLTLSPALPAVPVTGDTYTIAFTPVDVNISQLRGAKSLGDTQNNPYGPGPSFVDAVMKTLGLLGASVPSYLNAASAEPFGLGSPHAGAGGTHGHGALTLCSDMLQRVRDAVAAYTAPA